MPHMNKGPTNLNSCLSVLIKRALVVRLFEAVAKGNQKLLPPFKGHVATPVHNWEVVIPSRASHNRVEPLLLFALFGSASTRETDSEAASFKPR